MNMNSTSNNNFVLITKEDIAIYNSKKKSLFENTNSIRKKVHISLFGNTERLKNMRLSDTVFNFGHVCVPPDTEEPAFISTILPFILEKIFWCNMSIYDTMAKEGAINVNDKSDENARFLLGVKQSISEKLTDYIDIGMRIFTIDINENETDPDKYITLSGGKRLNSKQICDSFGIKGPDGMYMDVNRAFSEGIIKDNETYTKTKDSIRKRYHTMILKNSSRPDTNFETDDYYPPIVVYDITLQAVKEEYKDYELHCVILVGSVETADFHAKNILDIMYGVE